MSAQGLAHAVERMEAAGLPRLAIDVFTDYYRQLEGGSTGLISENSITPIEEVEALEDVSFSVEEQAEALSKTVFIRLNGGLGTSMGMDRAKSLLPVRDGLTFLDIIIRQLQAVGEATGTCPPLILMNSFRTRQDSLDVLSRYPQLNPEGIPVDFCQHREPKLLADSLEPADWPANPELEWCPPGHGDIYVALQTTGILDELIARGYRYANSANADNLGAAPDGHLAAWFAASGAPYSPEVCLRTPADRKGGHLAIRACDGRMILRDTAQTPEEDMKWFTDERRHRFFHTNNLWFDLVALRDALAERGGLPALPLIRNRKHLDPSDSSSPEVYQVESALGAIVEVFDGARPILVPRSRFLPVKTTDDLALVRSDIYELDSAFRLEQVTESTPLVRLDPAHYRLIADFEARFPAGIPSLREATSLTVTGDWTFGAGVIAKGEVVLEDTGRPMVIKDGTQL